MKRIEAGSMVIGYVHPGATHGDFPARIGNVCLDQRNPIVAIVTATNPEPTLARNAVIEMFLNSRAEWLQWIDDDATFDSDAPAKLLYEATTQDAKRAHGYSFGYDPKKKKVFGGAWTWRPRPMKWDPMEITGERMWVDGTGNHFQLVHRDVYEAMGQHDWHKHHYNHPITGKRMGQDLAFCLAALDAGMGKILFTPWVQTGHIKEWEIGYSDYLSNHDEWTFDADNK